MSILIKQFMFMLDEKKQKKFIGDSPKSNFLFGLIIGIIVVLLIGFGFFAGRLNNNRQNKDSLKKDQVTNKQNQNQKETVVDLKINKGDHYLGNKNSPIKIFEFSDFQCPYCAKHQKTMNKIIKEYGDKVVWVYKQFPISSHPLGMPGAIASECAGEQGKFFEFADKIFTNQKTLTSDSFRKFANDLSLNIKQYNKCVSNNKYKEKILSDYNLGIKSGVRGTPSNFINNKLVPGAVPYESIKQIIDGILNNK